MTLEDIYFIASIFAAFSVVVSLIFVGLQVRQSTAATKAAAAQAVHSNFAGWYLSLQSDLVLSEIGIKGTNNYASLTVIERAQFISLFMAFTSYMQDAYYKWRDESLSPELWRGWEYVSMNFFNSNGGRAFWDDRSYMFGQSFQSFINDDLLKRAVHPNAKPLGAFKVKDALEEPS
ncbi:MAG: hypothetical protein COA85_11125 [Robiginitomaculum sp.]|nr:MAG: hypothetical protein COA85_11125 [Robiginitomaculum sp.]